jgi:hypothetical protein
VFRLVLFFFFIFSLCVLCSCGGGTSAGAAAANASNSSSVANTNTGTASGSGATTVISTDTLTVAQFWNENVSTAYASSGQISGYVYKDFPYSKLDSAVLSIDKISGKTTLKIRHENHGAANGDLVTISGLQLPLHGIDSKNLNATHAITLLNMNDYSISVAGLATSTAIESFNAKLNYKILDCYGKQVIEKSAVENTGLFYEGLPLLRTKTVVNTTLSNCSPPNSQFTTYRHYVQKFSCSMTGACGSNYELIRQEIVGGLYAYPQDWFFSLFPSGTLKSGDKGEVGVLLNYADSARTDKQGKTVLSYEVLSDTCCSVLLAIISKTYDSNGTLIVEVKDYYGKSASSIGLPYSLVKTVATYNNLQKNEVNVVYSGLKLTGN